MKSRPVIAIVGRPNVGKSTLFNRFLRNRKALVEDVPGVTRDRIYGSFDWDGRTFDVIDTGGLDVQDPSSLKQSIRQQVQVAMREADIILVVVDIRSGPTSLDADIIDLVRPLGKPYYLVANKADNAKQELSGGEFFSFGVDHVIPVSATHGRGVGDLIDLIVKDVEFDDPAPAEEGVEEPVRITFVGRPNAGKSSMVNSILKEQRLLVDSVAGTTMDAVEVPFARQQHNFVLVDTAGLRRKKAVEVGLEKLAGMHAINAMERSHIVVLVLDANLGVHEQDARLAQLAVDRGKGLVIALNKWDLVKGRTEQAKIKQQVKDQLRFVPWAAVVPTSTINGHGLGQLFDQVVDAHKRWNHRVSTSELNRFLQEAVEAHHPPMAGRRPLKFYYMTQPQTRPPMFVVHGNRKDVPESYQRYLSNHLREVFSFPGTPLRLFFRSSHGDPNEKK
ncbi:MAG: ribosome biogenesis GTPase Der [Deltaproteobacteria bacterium HGW-Deltaproteobacteria-17]|nr:MAG: ribosome biogenesis GTPase Der [Deltaproteobacteria bacterium HGW-Deltaproteobacteria-17]